MSRITVMLEKTKIHVTIILAVLVGLVLVACGSSDSQGCELIPPSDSNVQSSVSDKDDAAITLPKN